MDMQACMTHLLQYITGLNSFSQMLCQTLHNNSSFVIYLNFFSLPLRNYGCGNLDEKSSVYYFHQWNRNNAVFFLTANNYICEVGKCILDSSTNVDVKS